MEKAQTCAICGHENRKGYYFCEECGHLNHDSQFSEEIYILPALKLRRIMGNLPHVPHKPVPWDKTTDEYVRVVEKLEALFCLEELKDVATEELRSKISHFYSLCHDPDFQIAFVGTIKTGKSTLINALLGRNYASMNVTPETAALTKFRSSMEDFVKVTFYTKDEWKDLWASRQVGESNFEQEYNLLDADSVKEQWVGHESICLMLDNADIESELERWSSSKHPEHFFVKEIEVGISTLKDVPSQVVFVDTPGLLDSVAYRSDITRDYIKNANAVFVCIDAQEIQAPEIQTIYSVLSFSGNKKDKVYIVATHWDKLNDPEEAWKMQKPFFARQLTGKAGYPTEQDARENILHSAAFLYNISRDYPDVTDAEKRALKKFLLDYDRNLGDSEAIDFIKDKANVAAIQKVIREKLIANYQTMRKDEIRSRYEDILLTVERIVQESQTELQGLLANSNASVQELRRELEEQEKTRNRVEQSANQLNEMMKRMNEETDEMISRICQRLREKLEETGGRKKRRKRKS